MSSKRSPARIVARGGAILLISGVLGATLVRLAPGLGFDEQRLDPRFSSESVKAHEREYSGQRNPFVFYVHFLRDLLRGEGGQSIVFAQPVGQLIADRAPSTLRQVAAGLAMGWIAACSGAAVAAVSRRLAAVLPAMVLNAGLLSIPSAVLATVCLVLRFSPAVAIAAVVYPRVFPHAYEQLRANMGASHVVMAQARGVPPVRVFLFHVLPGVWAPMIALAGVSVSLAFSASIPIEALADSGGIGQLAWRAALGRDLPVLVSITLMLTAVTVFANVTAELLLARLRRRAK